MKTQDKYKPVFLENAHEIARLRNSKCCVFVDAFSHQLKEIFFIKNNEFIGQRKVDVFKTKEFKNFCHINSNNFVHIYFPWNDHLVKTMPRKDYLELKTNRNKDLITKKEQEILSEAKIGVFGMSVGSNIAFVLTQASISNKIVIADFDCLDTTNLNRILAGVHQIGLPKVVVAARRIYEDNPFAKVTILPKGVNVNNLESMLQAGKLDILIEEIDDIEMKIRTRMLARKYKIPVVMITDNGDGVVLHIERYDLGYKKIFGKDLSYWENIIKQEMTRELAGRVIMNDIVGGRDKVDPRMLISVARVLKKELVSWSQLGSAAMLGGVCATLAAKRILLKEDKRLFVVEHINF